MLEKVAGLVRDGRRGERHPGRGDRTPSPRGSAAASLTILSVLAHSFVRALRRARQRRTVLLLKLKINVRGFCAFLLPDFALSARSAARASLRRGSDRHLCRALHSQIADFLRDFYSTLRYQ